MALNLKAALASTTSATPSPELLPPIAAELAAKAYAEARSALDEAKAIEAAARAELEGHAARIRELKMSSGDAGSVKLGACTVIYREAYRSLPIDVDPVLREGLGEDYHRIISRADTARLKPGTTIDDLKRASGDNWRRVRALFDTKRLVKPSKGTAKLIAERRRAGVDTADLEELIEACAPAPSVRVKK